MSLEMLLNKKNLPLEISEQNFWMPITGNTYSGIYMITNEANGHSYIGMSKNILRRWPEHRSKFKTASSVLYRAIRKYGLSRFTFFFLELVDDIDKIPEKEVY